MATSSELDPLMSVNIPEMDEETSCLITDESFEKAVKCAKEGGDSNRSEEALKIILAKLIDDIRVGRYGEPRMQRLRRTLHDWYADNHSWVSNDTASKDVEATESSHKVVTSSSSHDSKLAVAHVMRNIKKIIQIMRGKASKEGMSTSRLKELDRIVRPVIQSVLSLSKCPGEGESGLNITAGALVKLVCKSAERILGTDYDPRLITDYDESSPMFSNIDSLLPFDPIVKDYHRPSVDEDGNYTNADSLIPIQELPTVRETGSGVLDNITDSDTLLPLVQNIKQEMLQEVGEILETVSDNVDVTVKDNTMKMDEDSDTEKNHFGDETECKTCPGDEYVDVAGDRADQETFNDPTNEKNIPSDEFLEDETIRDGGSEVSDGTRNMRTQPPVSKHSEVSTEGLADKNSADSNAVLIVQTSRDTIDEKNRIKTPDDISGSEKMRFDDECISEDVQGTTSPGKCLEDRADTGALDGPEEEQDRAPENSSEAIGDSDSGVLDNRSLSKEGSMNKSSSDFEANVIVQLMCADVDEIVKERALSADVICENEKKVCGDESISKDKEYNTCPVEMDRADVMRDRASKDELNSPTSEQSMMNKNPAEDNHSRDSGSEEPVTVAGEYTSTSDSKKGTGSTEEYIIDNSLDIGTGPIVETQGDTADAIMKDSTENPDEIRETEKMRFDDECILKNTHGRASLDECLGDHIDIDTFKDTTEEQDISAEKDDQNVGADDSKSEVVGGIEGARTRSQSVMSGSVSGEGHVDKSSSDFEANEIVQMMCDDVDIIVKKRTISADVTSDNEIMRCRNESISNDTKYDTCPEDIYLGDVSDDRSTGETNAQEGLAISQNVDNKATPFPKRNIEERRLDSSEESFNPEKGKSVCRSKKCVNRSLDKVKRDVCGPRVTVSSEMFIPKQPSLKSSHDAYMADVESSAETLTRDPSTDKLGTSTSQKSSYCKKSSSLFSGPRHPSLHDPMIDQSPKTVNVEDRVMKILHMASVDCGVQDADCKYEYLSSMTSLAIDGLMDKMQRNCVADLDSFLADLTREEDRLALTKTVIGRILKEVFPNVADDVASRICDACVNDVSSLVYDESLKHHSNDEVKFQEHIIRPEGDGYRTQREISHT